MIGKYVFLTFANKDIVVHSHVGIRSNEKADYAAKPALDLPRVKVGVPYTDFRQYILSTRKDLLERCDCELASFCQAGPGRLAVLVQARKGRKCFI